MQKVAQHTLPACSSYNSTDFIWLNMTFICTDALYEKTEQKIS